MLRITLKLAANDQSADSVGELLMMVARVIRPFLALGAAAGLALAVASAGPALAQQKPLTYRVINSSPGSLNTNFTLIMGEKDAVLVDTPFLRSDAYRLAGEILDSGKNLKTIIVTHGHPDHYFGAAVLKEVFPHAEVIAQPEVVDNVWGGFRNRLEFWGPQIGVNAPVSAVMPTPFKEKSFLLEGREIQLVGPVQGDAVNSTFVYVPSLKLVAAGDIIFNQQHIGFAAGLPQAQRTARIATTDRIAALTPDAVIAGHAVPTAPNDRSSLTFTRDYLARVDAAVKTAASAEEYAATMRAWFPTLDPAGFATQGATVMRNRQPRPAAGAAPVAPAAAR